VRQIVSHEHLEGISSNPYYAAGCSMNGGINSSTDVYLHWINY
jgi:hypothetical protein